MPGGGDPGSAVTTTQWIGWGITALGFVFQYIILQNKLDARDRRDQFYKIVAQPISRLQSELADFEGLLDQFQRNKVDFDAIHANFVKLNRRVNTSINDLGSSSFDSGDGWIAIDTSRLENAVECLDTAANPAAATKDAISCAERLSSDLTAHMRRCESGLRRRGLQGLNL